MKNIILGSASPRRRELLAQIGFEFEVITSDAKEESYETSPSKMVRELSANKAWAVWEMLSEEKRLESIVIGADTIVYSDGEVLGKPADTEDAFNMIKKIAGRSHSVLTGVTVISKETVISFAEETKVSVYPMTDDEIRTYINRGTCMDKAGSYGIQNEFAAYVKGIEGDYNNVVGLPVARLYQEMKKAGYLND